MKRILVPDILIPICFSIVGVVLIFWIVTIWLKNRKLLIMPYVGMEWSLMLYAAATQLGVFFVTSGMVKPVFQTYRSFKSTATSFSSLIVLCFEKFAQYFLIVSLFTIIYLAITRLIAAFYPGQKNANGEIKEGNLSISIFMVAVTIGLSLIFREMASEMLNSITPYTIDIR